MVRFAGTIAVSVALFTGCSLFGAAAKEVRPPRAVFADAAQVSKGAEGLEAFIPRARVVFRRIENATPEEVQTVFRSSACESIALMLTEGRFPTQAEMVGFLADAFYEQSFDFVFESELQSPAAIFRGTLAEALTNEEGVITEETLEDAATQLGCALAA